VEPGYPRERFGGEALEQGVLGGGDVGRARQHAGNRRLESRGEQRQ
jgi:hypothetical protein